MAVVFLLVLVERGRRRRYGKGVEQILVEDLRTGIVFYDDDIFN